MKKFMLLVMLLFTGAFTNAQNSFHIKEIEVLPGSRLNITGDTNISAFECDFNTTFLKDPKKVLKYSGSDTHLRFSNALLVLNTKGFGCGNSKINKDFHDLIKSDRHPEILLELNELKLRSEDQAIAGICITIAGIQKIYEVPVRIKNGPIAEYQGKLKLDIKDFSLQAPKKLLGLIVVKEDIEINFNLLVKNEYEK